MRDVARPSGFWFLRMRRCCAEDRELKRRYRYDSTLVQLLNGLGIIHGWRENNCAVNGIWHRTLVQIPIGKNEF